GWQVAVPACYVVKGEARVPTISTFLGITIRMYFGDHAPPHFHAYYSDVEAVFAIETLDIVHGALPRRARNLVVEWAFEHRDELHENWRRIEAGEALMPIEPLE
ncbi:MAG: DUF4160 domain-containing protein, partial [Myxococcota bacterium]